MSTIPRTQTAFRLKNDLLERIKVNARRQNKSLNSFVEDVLEREVPPSIIFPKLTKEDLVISEEAKSFTILNGGLPDSYKGLTAEEQAAMDNQIKLEALIEKYGD